jgi:hypothetical protein
MNLAYYKGKKQDLLEALSQYNIAKLPRESLIEYRNALIFCQKRIEQIEERILRGTTNEENSYVEYDIGDTDVCDWLQDG